MKTVGCLGFYSFKDVTLYIQRVQVDVHVPTPEINTPPPPQEVVFYDDMVVFIFRRGISILAKPFHCSKLTTDNAKEWLFGRIQRILNDESILCDIHEHCLECSENCSTITSTLRDWLKEELECLLASGMQDASSRFDGQSLS